MVKFLIFFIESYLLRQSRRWQSPLIAPASTRMRHSERCSVRKMLSAAVRCAAIATAAIRLRRSPIGWSKVEIARCSPTHILLLEILLLLGVVSGGRDGCRPYSYGAECGTPCSPAVYAAAEAQRRCERRCQPTYFQSSTYSDDKHFGWCLLWHRNSIYSTIAYG